jgi:hypothetical protein
MGEGGGAKEPVDTAFTVKKLHIVVLLHRDWRNMIECSAVVLMQSGAGAA